MEITAEQMTIIGGLLALGAAIFRYAYRAGQQARKNAEACEKQEKLERRVDTLEKLMYRRAFAAGISKGIVGEDK